jgi:hypothetical protein
MKRLCGAVLFGAFFSTLSTAHGGMSYLTLTGRIYDLSSSHPNMEPDTSGIETGIVMPDLGDDLRPGSRHDGAGHERRSDWFHYTKHERRHPMTCCVIRPACIRFADKFFRLTNVAGNRQSAQLSLRRRGQHAICVLPGSPLSPR